MKKRNSVVPETLPGSLLLQSVSCQKEREGERERENREQPLLQQKQLHVETQLMIPTETWTQVVRTNQGMVCSTSFWPIHQASMDHAAIRQHTLTTSSQNLTTKNPGIKNEREKDPTTTTHPPQYFLYKRLTHVPETTTTTTPHLEKILIPSYYIYK